MSGSDITSQLNRVSNRLRKLERNPIKEFTGGIMSTNQDDIVSDDISNRDLSDQMDENKNDLVREMDKMYSDIKKIKELMENLPNEPKPVPPADTTDSLKYLWRTYDGSGNNLANPSLGMINTRLSRKSIVAYADGVSALASRGAKNPSPRVVSNSVCKSATHPLSLNGLSTMMWGWGQFLDHEIDLTRDSDEEAFLTTSSTDPNEDYPERTIEFKRSKHIADSVPRQHPNEITAFIDATNVYGSDRSRAHALRRLDGSGKMKVGQSQNGEIVLPENVDELDNAFLGGQDPKKMFAAGDVRANENVFLISLHVLFVREHNRLCDEYVKANPGDAGKDELIYQYAKRIVAGIMQRITYEEFLPALIGEKLPSYDGYKGNVDPSIATEFSTVGYRFGHGMVTSNLVLGAETLNLRDIFFKPEYVKERGVDHILRHTPKQLMKEINGTIVEDLRSFLFGAPTQEKLLDLASLNMQRGRDHGIGGYNDVRTGYGLARRTLFSQITSNLQLQAKLYQLYGTVDAIDPWIGCLVEDHVSGGAVGELIKAILVDQFTRLRDGDRFYYENHAALDSASIEIIKGSRLSDVIVRNTSLTANDLDLDVFRV